MSEVKKKCKYFNSGYCKYQDKWKMFHPIQECDNKCNVRSCMKRHVKPCRYGKNCRHAEKCVYSHKGDTNYKEMVSINNTLKGLQDYKIKSEVRIKSLEEELQKVKSKKGKEKLEDSSIVSQMNKLEDEFKKLKGEF